MPEEDQDLKRKRPPYLVSRTRLFLLTPSTASPHPVTEGCTGDEKCQMTTAASAGPDVVHGKFNDKSHGDRFQLELHGLLPNPVDQEATLP
jgi:hypothetical protein